MVTFHTSHASDSSSTALSWVWVLIYWRIFLNVSSTLSFGPSLYAMLQREFLFMLLSVCQQYSTITCYLMIPSLWWGASVSSVLLIKFQSYKGTVPGPQGCSLLSVPVLLWGAVLGPLQIFAPLVKEKLFCFLCALPPDAGEAFPIALSKIVCVAFSQQFKTFIMKRCQETLDDVLWLSCSCYWSLSSSLHYKGTLLLDSHQSFLWSLVKCIQQSLRTAECFPYIYILTSSVCSWDPSLGLNSSIKISAEFSCMSGSIWPS